MLKYLKNHRGELILAVVGGIIVAGIIGSLFVKALGGFDCPPCP
jgi:hypothetical protein